MTTEQNSHLLMNKWQIYENYQTQDQKIDYKDTIQQVCEFNSAEELVYIFEKTIYGNIRQIFTDTVEQKIKVFSRFNSDNPASTTGTEVLIVGLAIFKNGIHPSWEDPANHKAGELQFEASHELLPKMNDLFKELVYILVGQDKKCTQRINGIRAVDKLNAKQGNHVRFEVWVDFDPRSDDEELKQEKSGIDDILIKIQQQFGSNSLNVKIVAHSK